MIEPEPTRDHTELMLQAFCQRHGRVKQTPEGRAVSVPANQMKISGADRGSRRPVIGRSAGGGVDRAGLRTSAAIVGLNPNRIDRHDAARDGRFDRIENRASRPASQVGDLRVAQHAQRYCSAGGTWRG